MKGLKQPYMAVDQGRQITVRDASNEPKPFAFDYCFDSRDVKDAGASQAEVFEAIGKKVRWSRRRALLIDGSIDLIVQSVAAA